MGGRGVVEEGRYRRGGGGGEVDDKTSSPSCASILGLKPAMSLITPQTIWYNILHICSVYCNILN